MDIWCIGDLNYFVSVLNGLAMLSNAGLFNDLVKLGLIIAIVFILFQTLFHTTGVGLPFGRFLVAFIAFKFLFGVTTTVHVHDTYTLQSRSVDHVPYGVAVTGSILSQAAHEITATLEQAFSLPHMTDNGFAVPLERLIKTRKFKSGLDTLHDGKITRTLVEYADKCTSTGINKGQINVAALKTSADPWYAMRWNSNIYYATTWLPSDPPEGTLRTCTEAWQQIDNYLSGQLWSDWNDFLSAMICLSGTACDPVAKMQSALDNLVETGLDARKYMLAAVLLPVFEEGQIESHSFMGKPEMAVIVGQAREQRNIQWQAEGSLFMNVARPMMAFFEGFLYAITPFMALLVAFVPAGLGLVGKYFMMFLWVQLWMPIMAILNHYVQSVAQQKLSSLIDGSIPVTSLQGHLMGLSTINDWLGVAGVLAASTPAISLALLFGGAITMTHLAGRLQGGDFINEKIGAPDVVQPAAVLAMQPQWTGGDTFGLHKTGMKGPAGEVSLDDTIQSSVASLRLVSQTSGIAFGQSLRETVASGQSGVSGLDSGTVTTDSRVSDVTESQATAIAYAQSLAYRSGLQKETAQKLQGIIGGELSGGAGIGYGYSVGQDGEKKAGFKLIGPDGHISANLKSAIQQNFTSGEANSIIRNIENDISASGSHDDRAIMQDRLATDSKTGDFVKFMQEYDAKKIQDTQEAGKRLYDAKKNFSEAVQMSRVFSSGAKINLLQAAQIWRENHGSARKYANIIPGVHEGWEKEINRAEALGASQANAEWIGLFRRLNHMARQGDMDAFKKLSQLAEEALGAPSMNMGDPYQYRDIAPSGLTAYADGIERKAGGLQHFAPGEVEGGISDIRDRASGHTMSKDELAQNYVSNSMASIYEGEKQAKQNIFSGHEQAVRDKENQLGPLKNKAQSVAQWASSGLSTMSGFGSAAKVVGSTAASVAMSGFRSLLEGKEIKSPYEFLNEGMKGYMQSLVAEGKAHGFSDAESQYYAQIRGNAFARWLSQHFGRPIKNDWINWNQEMAKQQAVGDQAKFYRDHGISAPEALERAERDMKLIKDTAESGGNIDYAAPVAQVREKIRQLENQTRAMREQVIMGAPKAGGKVGSLEENEFQVVSRRVNRFDDIVQRAAEKHGVDPNLIKAVITAESKGDPHAINEDSGAKGLMQLMDGTARDYGIKPNTKDIYDPEKNIMAGTEHLAKMLDRYHGNTRLALAAYNWGHGNLDDSGGRYGHIKETRNFVRDVTAYQQQYAAMDYHGRGQEMAAGIPGLRKGKVTIQELQMAAGLPDEQKPGSGERKSGMLAKQPDRQIESSQVDENQNDLRIIKNAQGKKIVIPASQMEQAPVQPSAQLRVQGQTEPVAQGTGQGQVAGSAQGPRPEQVQVGPVSQVTGQPSQTERSQVAMAGNPLAPNSQAAPPPEKSWSDYTWSLITPSPAHAAEGPPPGTGVQGPTQGPVSGPAQPEPAAQVTGTAPLVTGVAQTTQEPKLEPGPVSGPAQPEPVAQVTRVVPTMFAERSQVEKVYVPVPDGSDQSLDTKSSPPKARATMGILPGAQQVVQQPGRPKLSATKEGDSRQPDPILLAKTQGKKGE